VLTLAVQFKLPDLGEGVAEGEIVKWLVSEGQDIKEDQPMVEVMTDKATVQIPSPTSGKVKQILTKEGQMVKVGTTMVVLESSDGKGIHTTTGQGEPSGVPLTSSDSKSGASTIAPSATAPAAALRIVATPATRKLARELNVEIERISGTGPGGRIMDEDVRSAATGRKSAPSQVSVTVQSHAEPKVTPQIQPSVDISAAPKAGEEKIPLHGIRKRIAEKMSRSVHTAAHVYHIDEVDYTELIKLRDAARPIADARSLKLTYLPFIIKAATLILREFPYFNASIDDEKSEIILKHYYNIGFATDTPNGLIVPVVKNVDTKKILEIAREVEELAEQARKGTISLDNIQGGTFTITNIGTLGGIMAAPIINHPEVAILGVSKFQKRPVVIDDEITVRPMGYVTLSFDHRIVDGAQAARFTTKLIEYLESPSKLLFDSL